MYEKQALDEIRCDIGSLWADGSIGSCAGL